MKASRLTSYFGPISVIKRAFTLEQRVLLIEHPVGVPFANSKLDRDEDHYVRKIAHLLYMPNTQSMLARACSRSQPLD